LHTFVAAIEGKLLYFVQSEFASCSNPSQEERGISSRANLIINLSSKLQLTEDRAPFAQHFFLWNLMNSTDECTHTHVNILHSITRKADIIGMCNLKYRT
jgi:hypothetical protein